MYIKNKRLERELAFTETYKANINKDKAIREAACLKTQISTYFVKPQDSDIIAGRIDRPLLTFSPCLEGDYIDKIAYGINKIICLEEIDFMKTEGYDEEYIQKCYDMVEFWDTENTNTKIRNRFPKEWGVSFGKDEFYAHNSVIHPLYRLAGANLDFRKLFKFGLCGLQNEIKSLMSKTNDEKKIAFYEGTIETLESVRQVLKRYSDYIKVEISDTEDNTRKNELIKMSENLDNVYDNPPKTLHEAVQLMTVYLLCGRNVELGRIDNYLGEFYKNDIENGTITKQEAVRLIDNLFTIMECERGRDTRAIIGGRGRVNEEAANMFAHLVMDVGEIRVDHFYPQISLRFYKGMDESLYNRALSILATGNTFPMLYNDDVNIPATMRAMDVPRSAAEQYSFFGCGEFMLAQKSIGTPNTAYNIAKVVEVVLNNGINLATGEKVGLGNLIIDENTSFDDLMTEVKANIDFFSDMSGGFQELVYDVCNENASFLLISCLYDCCLERGKAILDGGMYHLGGTVETYGNVTAYDSMTAIKKVVFEDKMFTLPQLVEMLNANFKGYAKERKMLINAPKFGNDDEFADEIATEMHEYVCHSIRNQNRRTRLDSFLVVVINNNMNVSLGKYVAATADGRLTEEYLSNGNSPYTGRDKEGVTALIKSMNKMDNSIHACGNQNVKLSKSIFETHPEVTRAILDTFFDGGGQQINLSVVNQAELEDAMINPENHQNLMVRVGGFTAKFVYIDKATQRDVLARTAY